MSIRNRTRFRDGAGWSLVDLDDDATPASLHSGLRILTQSSIHSQETTTHVSVTRLVASAYVCDDVDQWS